MSAQQSPPQEVDRGLLDTSAVIDLQGLLPGLLPRQPSISALTLAELAAGPHATDDVQERARRQERLQQVGSSLNPLAFDESAAFAYGRVYAATRVSERKPRGARAVDLLIASVALANGLPLFTRNPGDFDHLRIIGLDVRSV